jgi:S1-C subfamily serine protease
VSARCAAAALTALALAGCGGERARPAAPPSVLQVTVRVPGRAAEVTTAFAARDGQAVTVAHAVGRARTVLIARPGGRPRRARVASADARLDLALVAVPGLKAPAVRTTRARAGEEARVVVLRDGRPRALRATVRRAITARVRDRPGARPRVRPALELTATVVRGDSGAPVLDAGGRVLGMVFAQAADRADRAYALAAQGVPIGSR